MKKYLNPEFIMGVLIFFVIQPAILLMAIGIFVWELINHLL
jgi:hypothetical protein